MKEHGGLGAKYPSIYLGMLKNKKPKYKLSAPHKTFYKIFIYHIFYFI